MFLSRVNDFSDRMSASVLRYWRESASLILVGKAAAAVATSTPTTVTSQSQENDRNVNTPNYKILMLKRSSRMSFFPNFYVFPGGAADDADFSSEWLDILGPSFCSTTGPYSPRESLFRLFSRETKDNRRAPILSRKRDPKYSVIPSDIAFRICAIRETFEETGILLAYEAKSNATLEQNNNPNSEGDSEVTRRCTAKLCDLPAEQLNEWRHCVLKKSDNFLKMCRELNLIPDLTALSEWANWLTPTSTNKSRSKRFNTIFFITFVDYLPNVVIEAHESTSHMWQTPNEYFTQVAEGSIYLGPPQMYELNYMNFHSWETFHDDVERHPHFHAPQNMSVEVKCKDGSLFLFPGDDKYPKEVNFEVNTGTKEFPMTKQEFGDSNQFNHHYDRQSFVIRRNLPLSSLRAQPLKDSIFSLLLKSKL